MDMDLSGIVEALKHKSVLVTGSTGYLAKLFVEKVLRVQPQVNRIFLLVRALDTKSASQRLHKQVLGEELFKVLREKHNKDFDSFITGKVRAVAGDISKENLGLNHSSVMEEMWREVNIVVNVAATTDFVERYDVALGVNALGAKHVLEFAKKCSKLEMLLHVSTAYVAGEKSGLIMEKRFEMGETLTGNLTIDIELEKKLVRERLKELSELEATERAKTSAMKEFGTKRARLFGWQNTYVFTKAIGEMLLLHLREDTPLVIMRPTIITSTYREPFPGWIQGMRTIDSLILGYGKGKLTCFLGDPLSTIDLIPGDMVVNAMILAMVAHSNQRSEFIYHISSSVRNPIKGSVIERCSYEYFSKNPCIAKDGMPIRVPKVRVFATRDSFYRYMNVRYMLPLKGLSLVNATLCKLFQSLHNELNRKYNFVMRLIQVYEPYLFFQGRFDDLNLERLRLAMKDQSEESQMLCCDPKYIDWEDYIMNIHIPGLMKHVFK